ncbi:uncharacterized protein [Chironomus tepperi]|uniref:uncharacterized protein n=1 Tax=Chironomus tepperi TaxID=113505 RepID=UPI00391F1920
MALLKRMKIFTIFTLLGALLYVLISGSSSNLSIFSINFNSFLPTGDKSICKDIQNWDEIMDFEWLMFEKHSINNQSNYQESSQNFEKLFTKCYKYINYNQMTPSKFKTHQQHILDLIKIRNLNLSILDQSHLNTDLNCGKFPLETDLNITDIYWQVKNTTNGTFYLYNAYYDDRKGVNGLPFVRIIALINVIDPIVKTFCQFWYENVSEPIVVEVYEYRYIWNRKWGYNKKGATPYLISCEVPLSLPPSLVSLVQRRCENANNLMKVKNKRPKNNKKEAFIVAVKRFEFNDDISLQIIEWCEILKILGVNKVEFFVHYIHSNVLKVLKYYESEGFMVVKFIKYPSDLQNERKKNWHQYTQNQLISYHDTFYEHMYSYDFMIPMDTDEFIMPLRQEDRTWKDLMLRTISRSVKNGKSYDCYPVDNHYFLLQSPKQNESITDVSKNLYFLPNIYRAANFTPNGGNAKTFMRMDRVLTVHNHFPFSCLDDQNDYKCKRFGVSREDGQLSHYRVNCTTKECKTSMEDPERDDSLWKFKDEILENVKSAIKKINEYSSGTVKIKLNT